MGVPDVQSERTAVLRLMYDTEKNQQVLAETEKKKHIIDQWTYLRERIAFFSEHKYMIFLSLVKRLAIAPNAQAGCERTNSVYNLFKTKLSTCMELPIIQARLRIKTNEPPRSLFNPKPVRILWPQNGHQSAATSTMKKFVIERIRQQNKQIYTSKIFKWTLHDYDLK